MCDNDSTHFELFFDGLVKRLQFGGASVWDDRQAGVALQQEFLGGLCGVHWERVGEEEVWSWDMLEPNLHIYLYHF